MVLSIFAIHSSFNSVLMLTTNRMGSLFFVKLTGLWIETLTEHILVWFNSQIVHVWL